VLQPGYAHRVIDWIDWGDAPTWAATIGAVVAGVFAYRVLRIEQRRDARQDERDRRTQAELVTVWLDLDHVRPPGSAALVVGNSSTAGVYDVTSWLAYEQTTDLVTNSPVVPPLGRTTVELPILHLTTLGIDDFHITAENVGEYWAKVRAVVSFTDSAGQRWTRDRNGILREDQHAP